MSYPINSDRMSLAEVIAALGWRYERVPGFQGNRVITADEVDLGVWEYWSLWRFLKDNRFITSSFIR